MTHLSNNSVRILLLAALLGSPAIAPLAVATTTGAHDSLRVGSVSLQRCGPNWCGRLTRPLDPGGVVPGTLSIYFEFYPHAAPGAAAGTLVGAIGGPGYSVTDSRDEFLELFGPLQTHDDVLLMDYRGTGHSDAIDCHELERAPALTEANIGACGRSLGRAAPFYSTTLAADDLAAVLDALGIGRIGLYGESYGTYFAQVFARRHPERMRALVLDGAYPLGGPDYAWYPDYAPAMRAKFNIACQRSPACNALPGSSIEHIAPALERLRERPFTAQAHYGDDQVISLNVDASQLALVMFGGYPAYATLRETDAAARAFIGGDSVPLLRLVAETRVNTESRDPGHDTAKFSAGYAAAILCQDPPQIFDMGLPPAERVAERNRVIAERERATPRSYAPFTIDEYRAMPLDFAFIDQCVQWPRTPNAPLVSADPPYPSVPVLVVSGEFDSMTPVADGAAAAPHYPHAQHVIIANSFHVNALPGARSACGAMLVRRFLETLSTGDESCAAAVPPVHLVARFARAAHELSVATTAGGNAASEDQLRIVTAALLTCEDVLVRAREFGAGRGIGLRGGTFTVTRTGEGYRVKLEEVRWTEDVRASGQIDWPGRSGIVHAALALKTAAGEGTLELAWPEGVSNARATARGALAGKAVVAEAPAP
jgi:pimeloyl-ACP methyl ester carboxylesterase